MEKREDEFVKKREKEIFRRKYGLLIKAALITLALLAMKFAIDYNNLTIFTIDTMIAAFFGGVFFTMGILLAGSLTDYKESEKIPGELHASFKALYSHSKIMMVQHKDKKRVKIMQARIKGLLQLINSNFRNNTWKLKEIIASTDEINEDIVALTKGGDSVYISNLKIEIGTICKLSNRIETITKTMFIPAAYTIAEVATWALLVMMLFVKTQWANGGLIILGAVSLVLVSLLLLIKDMDNPFDAGADSYANADLSVLFELEEEWNGSEEKLPELSGATFD